MVEGVCQRSQGCCVGLRAPILVSFTTGSSRSRSPRPRIPPSPLGGRPLKTGYSCVEKVARASTSSHLSCHFDGFMAPADHHGVHHPFRLEGALLLHTAPCPYRPTDAPVGTQWYWALVPRRWGSRRACGWRQPVPKRVVRGPVDGPTVRDWLAAVNDGSPRTWSSCARRSVSRSRKMRQPSDPDRHAGPWGGVPV